MSAAQADPCKKIDKLPSVLAADKLISLEKLMRDGMGEKKFSWRWHDDSLVKHRKRMKEVQNQSFQDLSKVCKVRRQWSFESNSCGALFAISHEDTSNPARPWCEVGASWRRWFYHRRSHQREVSKQVITYYVCIYIYIEFRRVVGTFDTHTHAACT